MTNSMKEISTKAILLYAIVSCFVLKKCRFLWSNTQNQAVMALFQHFS